MALVFVQWLKCFAATNPGKRRPVLRSQELTDPPPGTSVFSLGNETSKLGHAKTHAPPVFLLFAHVKKTRVHLGGCSAKGAVVGGAGRLGPSCGSSPSKQRLECQPNTPPPPIGRGCPIQVGGFMVLKSLQPRRPRSSNDLRREIAGRSLEGPGRSSTRPPPARGASATGRCRTLTWWPPWPSWGISSRFGRKTRKIKGIYLLMEDPENT